MGLAAPRPGPRDDAVAIDRGLTLIAFEAMNHGAHDVQVVRTVLEGPESSDADETILRAIETWDGRVVDPAIRSFQHRSAVHPGASMPPAA